MKDEKIKILISGAIGPKFPLFIAALERSGAQVEGGYLPECSGDYDGLLLAGGYDVAPERYGESDNGSKTLDLARDECEFALIEKFSKENKPIFGICRGMQIMNVYFGGTLIGDLPETPKHVSGEDTTYHKIDLVSDSIIGRMFGDSLTVNSFHHQAVKDMAAGFKPTAFSSEDGVIEAMEHADKPWFGLQFHPERMYDPAAQIDVTTPFFDYFIGLCRERKGK